MTNKTWDLCECRDNKHISTIVRNVSYGIAKGTKKKLSNYPPGTYFVIAKNGTSPIKQRKDGTHRQVGMESSSRNRTTSSGVYTNPDGFIPARVVSNEEAWYERMYQEGKLSEPYVLEELPEDF